MWNVFYNLYRFQINDGLPFNNTKHMNIILQFIFHKIICNTLYKAFC